MSRSGLAFANRVNVPWRQNASRHAIARVRTAGRARTCRARNQRRAAGASDTVVIAGFHMLIHVNILRALHGLTEELEPAVPNSRSFCLPRTDAADAVARLFASGTPPDR